MDLLLSTKSKDVTTWRAAQDFTASFRNALLELTSSDRCGSSETVFTETADALNAGITIHQNMLMHLNELTEHVAAATPSTNLNGLTAAFYSDLYRYFGHFRSTTAFYQLSMAFLCKVSATIITRATDQLGLFARHLPELSLIAIGPAGRGEYSPFCPLQILLVHGETLPSQHQTLILFCHTLHDGFEEAGFTLDPAITPRSPLWRGTATEWRQRCDVGSYPKADDRFVNVCRLFDQFSLATTEGFDGKLKKICSTALTVSRPVLTHLVERMTSLSNGLGLMGRLKLERSGTTRGLFRLLDHGLLPLSAALSACALIKESPEIGNCERIRDLLRRRELDVELAERMLVTWHTLHGLYLLEQSHHLNGHPDQLLNTDELTALQRHSLKEALESVAIIQRHVANDFSALEYGAP